MTVPDDWGTGGSTEEQPDDTAGESAEEASAPQQAEQPDPTAVEPSEEPTEEPSEPLSAYEVADYLTGNEPDEEEIERRQAEAAWGALEDGSAVQHFAESQNNYEGQIDALLDQNPGIDS